MAWLHDVVILFAMYVVLGIAAVIFVPLEKTVNVISQVPKRADSKKQRYTYTVETYTDFGAAHSLLLLALILFFTLFYLSAMTVQRLRAIVRYKRFSKSESDVRR